MRNIGYIFKNKSLYTRALTHSSRSDKNYERLEFLGDSILDFLVGEYFYINCDEAEGKLSVHRSHFVSETYLSKIFDELNLENDVLMGKSYQGKLSKSIKGDVIEALLAAIYLDGGLESAKKFVYDNFDLESYKNIVDENYKSKLQELVQGNFKCKMTYDTILTEKGFMATFYMDEDKISTGQGSTKQEAEQMAAKSAISKLFVIKGIK